MQTTSQYVDSYEPIRFDDDTTGPTIADLESALQSARAWADALAADTTEPLITRAYGRIYERLADLKAEAVMIDRIARGR